jgi:hypothetical protein
MSHVFRKAYSVFGVLLLLEFLIQFYYIAAAILTVAAKPDSTTTEVINAAVHGAEGFLGALPLIWNPPVFLNGVFAISITILILIGFSFGARYPWRTTAVTALFFLVVVSDWITFLIAPTDRNFPCEALCEPVQVQGLGSITWAAGLHYVNALILTGLGIYLVVRNWAFRRQAGPDATVQTTSAQGG